MKRRNFKGLYFFSLVLMVVITSCSSYKSHILFKTDTSNFPKDLEYNKMLVERNYKIQVNDRLDIRVYTNEGERIIDPDYELIKEINNSSSLKREETYYFVQMDGMVKIPMIGSVNLEGKTLREAEAILEEKFEAFYKDPYVILKFDNKRVIVLGSTGGQIIPLENEDMNVLEVLAAAGGIPKDSKVQNIRLIRGDLKNPEVQLIDLSTVEGMMQADLKVYSGDIIYVEPVVRVFTEATKDFIPLISLLASTVALILALQNF